VITAKELPSAARQLIPHVNAVLVAMDAVYRGLD
jgi:hypothetical protein